MSFITSGRASVPKPVKSICVSQTRTESFILKGRSVFFLKTKPTIISFWLVLSYNAALFQNNMNTVCNLSPRWFSEREQRCVVIYSACLTWRLVMSPRRLEGHFLLLREGIYLPAPPLHLGTGHDLHKRYLSVSLRWWNTISSQRVPHRSAGVREGKQRTSLQECQKQDWLRSAGSTWSCGDLEESPIFQLRGSFHIRELFPHLFQQFTVYWAVFLYVWHLRNIRTGDCQKSHVSQ